MYKSFETNSEIEKDGVWNEIPDRDTGEKDFRVKLAHASTTNTALKTRLEALYKPYRRLKEMGALSVDKETEIVRQAFAETVVKGWETYKEGEYKSGIEGKDGTLLPFNAANVLQVLTALPAVFTMLQTFSFDMDAYRQFNREEDAKN
jgi:hypothetical protein